MSILAPTTVICGEIRNWNEISALRNVSSCREFRLKPMFMYICDKLLSDVKKPKALDLTVKLKRLELKAQWVYTPSPFA